MKIKILFLPVLLFYFLIPVAFAQNAAIVEQAIAPAPTIPKRGVFYRIQHQSNTAYLFGTVHAGKPSYFPLEPEVTRALQQSSSLIVEIDVRNNQSFLHAVRKHGFYANNQTIDKHLAAQSLAQLRRTLQSFDIPFEQIAHMKPWMVMNLLISLNLEQQGYQRKHGTEVYLLSVAAAQSKKVQELESVEYQLSLFDSLTAAEQERYLIENLDELRSGMAMKKARLLFEAWESANSPMVEKFLHDELMEKSTSAQFMQRVLLDKRNPKMADKIEALLKSGETAFVGVGLLHFVGDTGLPKLLRQRGYQVEKLY